MSAATNPRSPSFFLSWRAEGRQLFKLARWPQVRAILKDADVDAFDAEHGNEIERLGVGQQGKGKVGTS
tara:strand:- start:3035 stop:3241 length:207 start_codon:yes stop_codon:yes gene_type:complete